MEVRAQAGQQVPISRLDGLDEHGMVQTAVEKDVRVAGAGPAGLEDERVAPGDGLEVEEPCQSGEDV